MESARTAILLCGGVDPTGHAGLAADISTTVALGFHACPIVTALTVQDQQAVQSVDPVDESFLVKSLEKAHAEFPIRIVKLGLVPTHSIAKILHEFLISLDCIVVIDPVFKASSGGLLADSPARELWRDLKFPQVLWTPNLTELQQFVAKEIMTPVEIRNAMSEWAEIMGGAVLLKGGHHPTQFAVDYLLESGEFKEFLPQSIGPAMRGTGCRLATAIACFRASHDTWAAAITPAKSWLETLRTKQEGAYL